MSGKRHEDGEICNVYFGNLLAWGWCDEATLKEKLKNYLEDHGYDESFQITNISHEWMRLVPAPEDPDYTGYWHDASPHARGATKMTSAQIQW